MESMEFLVQSMVVKCDDEFIGFVMKFAQDVANLLRTSITGIHEIFLGELGSVPVTRALTGSFVEKDFKAGIATLKG